MLRRFACAAAGALVVLIAPSPARAEPPLLPAETTVLPNGLRLVLHEDHRSPQVAVDMGYRVGFADDPPGKRGLAHLFEHLMLRGSKHVGRDKFFSTLETAGASERNATTSFDRTSYYETLPASQLALALWLESDRLGYLLENLDDAVLATEKDVVRNEHRSGMFDRAYAFVPRFARNAIFPAGHPYHFPIENEIEELANVSLEDLRGFFRRWYVPSNATLTIAGDIDPARAKALVVRYFGGFPRAADPRASVVPPPEATRTETTIAAECGAPSPRVLIGWAGPPEFSEGDVLLQLVADVLARGKGGRLHAALVRSGRANAVDAGSDSFSTTRARIFWAEATLPRGDDPRRVLDAIDEVLRDLRASGPTPEEVAEAKSRFASALLWSLERITRRADLLDALDVGVRDAARIDQLRAWARGATSESLRAAIRTWLPPGQRAVVLVRHVDGAPISGRIAR